MEKLTLIKYPDPILLTPTQPVEITPDIKKFVYEMFDFMRNGLSWGHAAGLAANQLGKPYAIFIALNEVYINPEVLWRPKGGQNWRREGCFSLEDNKFDYGVNRAYAVKLKWQDLDGVWHEERFNDFRAQVIQHEMDHLQGILCCGEVLQPFDAADKIKT